MYVHKPLCNLLPGISAILLFVQTKEENNFKFEHILNFHDTLYFVRYSMPAEVEFLLLHKVNGFLIIYRLPYCLTFFNSANKIDQQFHDTLYFCKVLNAISEVEFLLLHIVGMQKSKYTTGYLTIQDNNQKCRSKRILRSNFPYLMHFRKGEKLQ